MAGEKDESYDDLGLSLGGVYSKGNSGGARMARAVSVDGNAVAEAAVEVAPRRRAVSMPSARELEMLRLTEGQFVSRVMAARLRWTIQKERMNMGAPAAAARQLPAGLAAPTASGRLAATSSTVSSELMSGEGSSHQPAVTASMRINTKRVKADDPQEDNAAKRARVQNRNVARPVSCEWMAKMPSVKTIGTSGKEVAGYLYLKYAERKVRIICVCHGTFHTPAEFVKHARGAEVENPLRQIIVTL